MILENLKWRYATMQFDTKREIPKEDLEVILKASNLSATGFGLQPFKIVVVTDQNTKDALLPHAYNQTHATQNSALIVFAVVTNIDKAFITEYTNRIESIRNLEAGSTDGFKASMVKSMGSKTPEERLIWAQKQAYIALGTMMVAASELHIDNHGLEGFNPAGFNEVLGLDALNLHATVILALGYRSPEDEKQHLAKVRKDLEDIVVHI